MEKKAANNYRPYFIADIAANHDGDIQRAYKLIELAKEAGADCAKSQNFKAKTIVSRHEFDSMLGWLSHQASWKKSVYETYEDASLNDEWSHLLKEYSDQVGIEYMTSPYDYSFKELGLQKIWTEIYVFDKQKYILFMKLGFHVGGELRNQYFYDGKWWNSYMLSILAEEWD